MKFDGMVFLQERDINNTTTNATYIYGKDVSGSINGAGGIGGILAADLGGQLRRGSISQAEALSISSTRASKSCSTAVTSGRSTNDCCGSARETHSRACAQVGILAVWWTSCGEPSGRRSVLYRQSLQ